MYVIIFLLGYFLGKYKKFSIKLYQIYQIFENVLSYFFFNDGDYISDERDRSTFVEVRKIIKKYLIIADDFTGANDTGVQLAKRGLETHVVLDGKNIQDNTISYVLDTESRNLEEEQAYKLLKNHLKGIFDKSYDLVYKKVDSTLRGNIALEVKAVEEEYAPELILFAPAFPSLGRITIDGIHFVNGIRIMESEFAKDPKKPVLEDHIQRILQPVFDEGVIHHSLDEIRENKIEFVKGRIHSFDVQTNEDLKRMIIAASNTNKKILWVGSAGMADMILQIHKPLKPVLSVVGSLSEVSRKQVKYAESKGVRVLKVDIGDLLQGENREKYVDNSVKIMEEGKDLIITSSYDVEDYSRAIKVGRQLSMNKEEVGNFTKDIMGEIGKCIVERVDNIPGVFITGGDTAIGFIYKTKALGSCIIDEIITGIPLMKLKGGDFDGFKMVTKAGAFGTEEDLFYSIEKLKEEK